MKKIQYIVPSKNGKGPVDLAVDRLGAVLFRTLSVQ